MFLHAPTIMCLEVTEMQSKTIKCPEIFRKYVSIKMADMLNFPTNYHQRWKDYQFASQLDKTILCSLFYKMVVTTVVCCFVCCCCCFLFLFLFSFLSASLLVAVFVVADVVVEFIFYWFLLSYSYCTSYFTHKDFNVGLLVQKSQYVWKKSRGCCWGSEQTHPSKRFF